VRSILWMLSRLQVLTCFVSSLELSSTSLPSNPPTPPSKTTEALRLALKTVNSQLSTLRSQWDGERNQLLGEKAVLQDAANRLNMQLGAAKGEARQALESGRQDVNEEAKARTNVETVSAAADDRTVFRSYWSYRNSGKPNWS
jgi:hypothetical protein